MSRRSRKASTTTAEEEPPPRPVMLWERASFASLVLGSSLNSELDEAARPSTMVALIDCIALMVTQLQMLQEFSASQGVKMAAARTHTAFKRCLDLCRMLPQVKDHETFYSLLSPFVARIKALEPGSFLVVPGGWKGGLVFFVLQCVTTENFTLAVCSAGDGLQFHPSRVDPATGMLQHNSPLLLRDIPVRPQLPLAPARARRVPLLAAPPPPARSFGPSPHTHRGLRANGDYLSATSLLRRAPTPSSRAGRPRL